MSLRYQEKFQDLKISAESKDSVSTTKMSNRQKFEKTLYYWHAKGRLH